MDLQDIFITNLKRFRKERQLTQEQLAELCGTETSYIGQIETRKRFPSLQFIERLAENLDIPPYFLYKPFEKKISDDDRKMRDELIETISKDVSDIFVHYGKV